MPGIRDALSQLPSWPGFAIAAVAVLSIGGWYYGTTYVKCIELRNGRAGLQQAIDAAAQSASRVLNLDHVVPGTWDEARIVQGHRPGQVPLNCPFGWDMTWRERQALIDAGHFTVIGFFNGNEFQHYIEYRGDRAVFVEPPKSIARANARFLVAAPQSVAGPYVLSHSP